ncbi:unnamed protein product, partial [Staurois parvus]
MISADPSSDNCWALIISAAPKVPSSGTHQCPAVRPISATQQCHPSVMTSSAIHQ